MSKEAPSIRTVIPGANPRTELETPVPTVPARMPIRRKSEEPTKEGGPPAAFREKDQSAND